MDDQVLKYTIVGGCAVLIVAAVLWNWLKKKNPEADRPAQTTGTTSTIPLEERDPTTSPDKVGERSSISLLSELITDSLFSCPLGETLDRMRAFTEKHGMSDSDVRYAALASLGPSVIKSMDDGVFSKEEEHNLFGLMEHYDLSTDALDLGSVRLLAKGLVIRDLLDAAVNPRYSKDGLHFRFQKAETLIWVWQSMRIAEIRTTTKVVGRSRGMSFRIMKGVYWRTGGFEGNRVSSKELRELGAGEVAVTSKHIYYAVAGNVKRIRHDKIIYIEPYADAVTFQADGARAHPVCLYTDDPWFLTNVLENAQNWDDENAKSLTAPSGSDNRPPHSHSMQHPEYSRLYAGWRGSYSDLDALVEIIVEGMFQSELKTLLLKLDIFAEDRGMSGDEIGKAVLQCLDAVAEKSMEDLVVTDHEEEYLTQFLNHFHLTHDDLSPYAAALYKKGMTGRLFNKAAGN